MAEWIRAGGVETCETRDGLTGLLTQSGGCWKVSLYDRSGRTCGVAGESRSAETLKEWFDFNYCRGEKAPGRSQYRLKPSPGGLSLVIQSGSQMVREQELVSADNVGEIADAMVSLLKQSARW